MLPPGKMIFLGPGPNSQSDARRRGIPRTGPSWGWINETPSPSPGRGFPGDTPFCLPKAPRISLPLVLVAMSATLWKASRKATAANMVVLGRKRGSDREGEWSDKTQEPQPGESCRAGGRQLWQRETEALSWAKGG